MPSFGNYAALPAIDAPNFLTGVTLGKGAGFAFKSERKMQNAEVQDALAICHTPYAISIFITGVLGFLVCAACWHMNMSGNFYHGARWMGLWDNPNTYGMLMGAGVVLSAGLLADGGWTIEDGENQKRNLASRCFGLTREESRNFFLRFFAAVKLAILFVAVGMMAVGLFFSYSSGAWVGTTAGLLYLAKAHGKLKWQLVLPVVFVAAAVVVFSGIPRRPRRP
jgi:O-antigen ligase